MPPQRRSRTHKNNKAIKKAHRTRRRTKDILTIHEDLKPENADKLKHQELDADLPGLGQHYCVECSRYFITEKAATEHLRGKAHKKRLRELKEAPYTQAEAEAAVGLTTENRRPVSSSGGIDAKKNTATSMALDQAL
ncbi:bud site selection-related protein [Thamnocephalis sphaerospora]|uniref:Bud site selection-related protein n=1 Tax=Thamnocephalis sphaerospora TaxID=78915 RepID=A0A4P9XK36_9FUNG|nr:bud site selection-related protein [Thamnocephalis sphaerospora]|eukprot:RKP06158.1 bud site selection-related protein [Thamnocephalis sphaerospora]